jgi:hypothetical protein
VVLGHERLLLLWFAVTRYPTAEWLARQITEAFPWDSAPKYLIRDNDRAFGVAFKARVRAMSIRDRLRRILAKYAAYYNEVRTHVSLKKDAPCRRPIERYGDIVAYPILSGLHHRYARI